MKAASTPINRILRWFYAAIAAYVLVCFLKAGMAALWHNAFFAPYNGTFQNFNPIARQLSGQIPIRDYDDPMGIGVSFVQMLATCLFGHTYVASRHGTFLAHTVAFLGIALFLGKISRVPWLSNVWLAVGLTVSSLTLLGSFFGGLMQAGDSSNGMRSVAPFLAAGLILLGYSTRWLVPSRKLGPQESLAFGAVGGSLLCWSPDYSVPVIGAVWGAWFVVHADPNNIMRCLLQAGLMVLATSACAIGVLAIAGHGTVLPYFRFMLDLGANNVGFNTVSANLAYYDLSVFSRHAIALVVGLVGLCWMVFRAPKTPASIAWIILLLCELLGFLIKVYDYTVLDRHVAPLVRLDLYLLIGAIGLGTSYWRKSLQEFVVFTTGAALCLFFMASLAAKTPALGGYLEDKQDQNNPFIPELGGAFDPSMYTWVKAGRQLKAEGITHFVMTYRTALAYIAGAASPVRNDYIVHAVGPVAQADYVRGFLTDNAPIAVAMNRDNIGYEAWLERKVWPFYRAMMLRYQPENVAGASWIWRKRPVPLKADNRIVPCTVARVGPRAYTITYDTRALPDGSWYLQTWPRFVFPGWGRHFLSIDESQTALDSMITRDLTPIWSYDARRTESPLPVIASNKAPATVKFLAYGWGENRFQMTGCLAKLFLPVQAGRIPDTVYPLSIQAKDVSFSQSGPYVYGHTGAFRALDLVRIGSLIDLGGHMFHVLAIENNQFMIDAASLQDLHVPLDHRTVTFVIHHGPIDMHPSWDWTRARIHSPQGQYYSFFNPPYLSHDLLDMDRAFGVALPKSP